MIFKLYLISFRRKEQMKWGKIIFEDMMVFFIIDYDVIVRC